MSELMYIPALTSNLERDVFTTTMHVSVCVLYSLSHVLLIA